MKKTTSGVTLLVLLLSSSLFLTSCEEQAVVGADAPSEQPVPADLAPLVAKAERMEFWISRMDPFVIVHPDGTYGFDQDSFFSAIRAAHPDVVAGLIGVVSKPSDDATIVIELRDGIAVANETMRKGTDPSVEGYACWTYWWGRRCCYWGSTGWWAVGVMAAGGALPVVGWGYTIYAAWAGTYMEIYGGFCLNNSWAGGVWLTRP